MAIVRTAEGKFYDIDDNVLEGKEVKPPEGAASQQSGPGPGRPGGGASPVQIIVNLPSASGAPAGAPPASGQQAAGDEPGQDVAGHWHHHHWGPWGWNNWWQNCWRNWHHW